MKTTRNCIISLVFLFATSNAVAQPSIYVLPVQSAVTFLTQMPGTNIFVGPGAASIFTGKVTINGKEYEKFPEPPRTSPEWADGLKLRIENAIRRRKDVNRGRFRKT